MAGHYNGWDQSGHRETGSSEHRESKTLPLMNTDNTDLYQQEDLKRNDLSSRMRSIRRGDIFRMIRFPLCSFVSSVVQGLELPLMNVLFQLLSDQEVPALLEMMREFYSQQHMRFDEKTARSAIAGLLQSPKHGEIYLIFRGPGLAGYFVITFCFSLEFHGRFALLDELYLREPYRRQKLGQGVVGFAEGICHRESIAALRLEVGRDNEPAKSLYRNSGFAEDARNLMTKWL